MGDASTYERDRAVARFREMYQEMRRDAEGQRRRQKFIDATAGAFERRMKAIPGDKFPIQEVEALDDIYRAQMRYGRELRMLEHQGLSREEFARRKNALDAEHAKNMENIQGQTGGHSELVTALHGAIEEAARETSHSGNKPSGPGDDIPTGRLPTGYGGYLQDAFPKDPTASEIVAKEQLADGDRAGGLAALDKAIANGGTADAYALRGSLRLESGDYDGAYQDAQKALALNPGDKGALAVLKFAEGRTTPGLASSPAAGTG
ncbi:MAG: hypothetical protein COV48_15310, partial [Elusimicrobia bacterium CG11_big_fil_rev_8_21_14_0_20_64_6]